MRQTKPKAIYESVAGLVFCEGRLLLGLRSMDGGEMDGRWEIPGGKVEPRDGNHSEALIREFEEEFSVTVETGHFVSNTGFSHAGDTYNVFLYYVHPESQILKSQVHSAIRYFDYNELIELVKSPEAKLVESDQRLLLELLEEGNSLFISRFHRG